MKDFGTLSILKQSRGINSSFDQFSYVFGGRIFDGSYGGDIDVSFNVRYSMGYLFMYDITNRNSFDAIKSLYERVCDIARKTCFPAVLCGQKCGLTELRQVKTKEGEALARSFGGVRLDGHSSKFLQKQDRM